MRMQDEEGYPPGKVLTLTRGRCWRQPPPASPSPSETVPGAHSHPCPPCLVNILLSDSLATEQAPNGTSSLPSPRVMDEGAVYLLSLTPTSYPPSLPECTETLCFCGSHEPGVTMPSVQGERNRQRPGDEAESLGCAQPFLGCSFCPALESKKQVPNPSCW